MCSFARRPCLPPGCTHRRRPVRPPFLPRRPRTHPRATDPRARRVIDRDRARRAHLELRHDIHSRPPPGLNTSTRSSRRPPHTLRPSLHPPRHRRRPGTHLHPTPPSRTTSRTRDRAAQTPTPARTTPAHPQAAHSTPTETSDGTRAPSRVPQPRGLRHLPAACAPPLIAISLASPRYRKACAGSRSPTHGSRTPRQTYAFSSSFSSFFTVDSDRLTSLVIPFSGEIAVQHVLYFFTPFLHSLPASGSHVWT